MSGLEILKSVYVHRLLTVTQIQTEVNFRLAVCDHAFFYPSQLFMI